MRKITKTYNIYKYKELSKEAKQKVLDKMYDINTDYDWYEDTIDYQKEQLDKIGFENADFNFSGFSSQGDGANFTADINIATWLKVNRLRVKNKELFRSYGDIKISIIRNSTQYEHSGTMGIEIEEYNNNPKASDQAYALENKILDNAKDEADRICRILEKEYEDLTSEQAIIETIELNEYIFLKDGTLFSE